MTNFEFEVAVMTMATQAMEFIVSQDEAHQHQHNGWGTLADALDYDTVEEHIQRIGFKDIEAVKKFYTAMAERKRF